MTSCVLEQRQMIMRKSSFRRNSQTQSGTNVSLHLWEWNRTRQMKHRMSSVMGEQPLPFHHHLKIVSIADLNRSKYYLRTRTGEIRGVTTKTYITPGLRHDLLSVKALNRQGYCVIQHPDHEESGIYPIIEGKIDKSKSFAFMSEHSNLFCLKPEMLTQQQFDKMSGYEKWHQRLAHVSNRDIQQSIKHTTGLEELINKTYEQHTKCGACMIGKSTLEDYPALKVRADKPLKQINADSFSSSVPSIEGYNHAAIFVDCNSGFRWIYGMKSKDDMLKVTKKWYSDIAELRQKYSLVVFMRDNAGENKSQEIIDFIESIGATNRFSTSYEQWQNGLAESAINSIMSLI